MEQSPVKCRYRGITGSRDGECNEPFYVTEIVEKMFFVYVLLSKKDNKYYIGFTADIKQRIASHHKGSVRSTKHRRPLELIYYEAYTNKCDAENREKFLKSGSGHRYLKKQLKNFLKQYRGVEQSGSSLGS